jgi:hypothetical protein
MPDGVNVTCFIDCCHSGTISRFAVGSSAQAYGSNSDQRPRFLNATDEMKAAHQQFRERVGRFRSVGARGPESMRDVLFSACLSTEVAWESNGHGDFTRHATALLLKGIDGISHEEFQRRVTSAFGAAPRQHPELDCAPSARGRGLLQPLTERVTTGAIPGVSPAISISNGDLSATVMGIAQKLQLVAQVLEK